MNTIQTFADIHSLDLNTLMVSTTNNRVCGLIAFMHDLRKSLESYDTEGLEYEISIMRGVKDIVHFDEPHMAKYVHGYMAHDLATAHAFGMPVDLDKVFDLAIMKARQHISDNPWHFAEKPKEVKLNADGTVAPKKGDKKVLAKQLYEKNKSNTALARKDWIALLVKEVGLTEAGASTYYANLKAGKY